MIAALVIILAIGLIVIGLGLCAKVYESGYRHGHDDGWAAACGDTLPEIEDGRTLWSITPAGRDLIASYEAELAAMEAELWRDLETAR